MRERIFALASLLLVALVSFQNLCYCDDEQTVKNCHFGSEKFLFLRFIHKVSSDVIFVFCSDPV